MAPSSCTFSTDKAASKRKTIEPMLLSFPQGVSVGEPLKFGAFQHEKHSKRRIVIAENRKVDFTGCNFGSERNALKPSRYLAFSYNKKTKVAKLLNNRALNQYVYSLKQTMPGFDVPDDTQDGEAGMTERARKRLLIETFGSQKKRREVKSYETNRLDTERVEAANSIHMMLREKVKGDGELSVEEAAMEVRRTLLPPFNENAEMPVDVYPDDQLVDLEMRSAVSKTVSQIIKDMKQKSKLQAMQSEGLIGRYALEKLESWADNHKLDKKEMKHKVRLLVVTQYMILFYRFGKVIRSTQEEIAEKLGDAPLVIVNKLLHGFTQGEPGKGKRLEKSKRNSDRLMLHILALCLHLEEFSIGTVALSKISADTGLPISDFANYFPELGCRSTGRDAERVVRLTTPLRFPDPSKRRARR